MIEYMPASGAFAIGDVVLGVCGVGIGNANVSVVVEGTPDELRAFAARLSAEVAALVGDPRPAPKVGDLFDGHKIVDVQDEGNGEYTIDLDNGAIGYVDTTGGAS